MVMGRPRQAPDITRAAGDRAYYDAWLDRLERRDITDRRKGLQGTSLADFVAAVLAVRGSGVVRLGALTRIERAVLAFAGRAPRFDDADACEAAVRDRFGFGAAQYFQILGSLLDRPEALSFAPDTVNRLRSRRATRSEPAPTVGRAA